MTKKKEVVQTNFPVELIALNQLKPHPQNYRDHLAEIPQRVERRSRFAAGIVEIRARIGFKRV